MRLQLNRRSPKSFAFAAFRCAGCHVLVVGKLLARLLTLGADVRTRLADLPDERSATRATLRRTGADIRAVLAGHQRRDVLTLASVQLVGTVGRAHVAHSRAFRAGLGTLLKGLAVLVMLRFFGGGLLPAILGEARCLQGGQGGCRQTNGCKLSSL